MFTPLELGESVSPRLLCPENQGTLSKGKECSDTRGPPSLVSLFNNLLGYKEINEFRSFG